MDIEESILLDDSPITTIISLTFEGEEFRYRQLVPEHMIYPEKDVILDVAGNRVYSVAAIGFDMSEQGAFLRKIMVVEEDGETIRYFNLNEIRILHDIATFNPALN